MSTQKIIYYLHLLQAFNVYAKDYKGDKKAFEDMIDNIIANVYTELSKIKESFYREYSDSFKEEN